MSTFGISSNSSELSKSCAKSSGEYNYEGGSSQSPSSSTKNSKKDPLKRAVIQQMKQKAIALKKELEETEKRSAHMQRIKDLETQLEQLSNEEATRLKCIGLRIPSTVVSDTSSKTLLSRDLAGIKQLCGQVRNAANYENNYDDTVSAKVERFRGGAGCGGCAIGRAMVNRFQNIGNYFDQNNQITRYTPIYLSAPMNGDTSASVNASDTPETVAGSGANSYNMSVSPVAKDKDSLQKPKKSQELRKLVNELLTEIDRIRLKNSLNRKRIVELCVEVKQKEAAITECSELLCHLMNEGDDVMDVMEEVQSGQLEKHVEYLRWILIRLQFENVAQTDEISSLVKENKDKDKTLKECKFTQNRLCAEKRKEEENLMKFTTVGACDLPMATIDIAQDNSKR